VVRLKSCVVQTQGSNPCTPQNELGFLVVTVLTMVSKLQNSSNKR